MGARPKVAARGSRGIRAVPVLAQQKGRRAEMGWAGGAALAAPSDPSSAVIWRMGCWTPRVGSRTGAGHCPPCREREGQEREETEEENHREQH